MPFPSGANQDGGINTYASVDRDEEIIEWQVPQNIFKSVNVASGKSARWVGPWIANFVAPIVLLSGAVAGATSVTVGLFNVAGSKFMDESQMTSRILLGQKHGGIRHGSPIAMVRS